MNLAFEGLMAIALIGAVDVLWFHLYRARLFARAPSLGEQATHLARHVLFALSCLLFVTEGRRDAILAVLVADLLNSAIDVLLEPRSRADLGGVSGVETLLHMLATFGFGAVTALVYTSTSPFVPTPMQVGRGVVSAGLGLALFAFELVLTIRHQGPRLERTNDVA
jgi:hypothetical protein